MNDRNNCNSVGHITETGSKAEPCSKVENLVNAIYETEDVLSHARSLLNKINSPDEKCIGPIDFSTMTLSTLMSDGPVIIRDRNAQLHDILNSIESHIF